jgi:polyketide biosynthesis acyl carrier protein
VHDLTPPATAAASADILSLIAQCIREIIPELAEHEFRRADRLAELGVNSMDRAEIVVRVLEALQLRIPRVSLAGARNIGELADLIHEKRTS